MRQAGQPSVEEILDSIKKVIARDSREVAAETRRQRESFGVTDGPVAVEPSRPASGKADVLDLAFSAQFLDDPHGHDEDGAEIDQAEDEVSGDSPLVTAEARSSMRQSLAALAMLAEPRAQPKIVRSGETSLEELARELLKPALAEWLDRNLPAMVERLVAAEIARIVGKPGKD